MRFYKVVLTVLLICLQITSLRSAPIDQPGLAWQGFYSGFSLGSSMGRIDYDPGRHFALHRGQSSGGHLGHLWQNQWLVYGAELDFITHQNLYASGYPYESLTKIRAVKLRLGYALQQSQIYAVIGRAQSDYRLANGKSFDTRGLCYGLGIEFFIRNRASIGLEVLRQNSDGHTPNAGQNAAITVESLSLRLSLRF